MLPYASFEFKTRGMVWGMMGLIDNQDIKGVLRKEKAITGGEEKGGECAPVFIFTVRNLESFPQQNTTLWGSSENLFQDEVSVKEVWNK